MLAMDRSHETLYNLRQSIWKVSLSNKNKTNMDYSCRDECQAQSLHAQTVLWGNLILYIPFVWLLEGEGHIHFLLFLLPQQTLTKGEIWPASLKKRVGVACCLWVLTVAFFVSIAWKKHNILQLVLTPYQNGYLHSRSVVKCR